MSNSQRWHDGPRQALPSTGRFGRSTAQLRLLLGAVPFDRSLWTARGSGDQARTPVPSAHCSAAYRQVCEAPARIDHQAVARGIVDFKCLARFEALYGASGIASVLRRNRIAGTVWGCASFVT